MPSNTQSEKSDRREFTLEHTLTHLTPKVSPSCRSACSRSDTSPLRLKHHQNRPLQRRNICRVRSASCESLFLPGPRTGSSMSTSSFFDLHRLPVGSHLSDKLLPLAYKCPDALAPRYRSDLLKTPHLRSVLRHRPTLHLSVD